MYKSIYFKIVLIFVIFMVTVMAVVAAILLNGVFQFYSDEFVSQMDRHMQSGALLRDDLENVMESDNFASLQKDILTAYSTSLGIDDYRNFYILDMDGEKLEASSGSASDLLAKTPNLLAAMNGNAGKSQKLGSSYSDYAIALESGDNKCIIYIYDTQEEMKALSWQLFTIILQALLIGLILAVVLSFVLSKAITSPIQNLTRGAKQISKGEFSQKLLSYNNDEIGELTDTFNEMSDTLKNTLDEVLGEREKLETVFSYLLDAVVAFTVDGRILHINKSAIELLGNNYNPKLKYSRFLKLLGIEYINDYIKNDDQNGQITIRDVEFRGKALDINVGRLRYIENNITRDGIITVIHDITARYELDKAQREFVANVSHELRTPLTSIKGASETILLYPDMEREMRDSFLNMAIEECNRMLRIVMDLLTLSRLDNNKTKWEISRFDINEMLIRLCQVMQVEAKEHRHSLVLTLPETVVEITADRERIEQVIMNIIANAVKYTPDGGEIEVRAEYHGEEIIIMVDDNGIGIPQEDLPRIFERFYRVEKARATEMGGTGLGLAIAKEIINAHGGVIDIESSQGKGTSVTVKLPINSRLES